MPFKAIERDPRVEFDFWYNWIQEEKIYPKTHKPEVIPTNQFRKVFPEGEGVTKRLLKEYKKELKEIKKKDKEELAKVRGFSLIEQTKGIQEGRYRRCWLEENIARLEKLEKTYSFNVNRPGNISVDDVKHIPISDYIEFNRSGFAKRCPHHSPNHNQKTPSLKFYPQDNRVHCFSCGWRGDIIDVIQELYGCDFREALKKLKNE